MFRDGWQVCNGATENTHFHMVTSNSYCEQSRRDLPAGQVHCKTEHNSPVGRAINVTTSLCCEHYYFSGSFILALRLLVTDTVLCNNPDEVPCYRFQSMNCKGRFTCLTSCGEWTKAAHFPVFYNIVYVISSTIRERRVPPNNSSGIPYMGIRLLNWRRWSYARWKVILTVISAPIINTFALRQLINLLYNYVHTCTMPY